MYADGFAGSRGFKPGSMALALGMTALPIVGLIMSTDITTRIIKETTLVLNPVHEDPPRPPDPTPRAKPDPKRPVDERVWMPPNPPPVDTRPSVDTSTTIVDTPPNTATIGTGEVHTATVIPPPLPVMVGAQVDPRYAGLLQPPYPAEEQRAGRSGRVVIRVLIGVDGRVRQVERVSAASDAFFAAAERQALGKWRFKPATKDGVPVEQWKVMSLRFEIDGQ